MSATPTNSDTPKPGFLMIGDSLVAGFNWQSRLPTFAVANYGIPGLSTDQLLSLLPRFYTKCPSAELIMVMIGTNDFLMGDHDFVSELKKILVWLSSTYPAAEILVHGLLPFTYPHDRKALTAINKAITKLCLETACCYVDIHSRFSQSSSALFEPDGVHLTKAGYELWARTLSEHIAFLREND